MTHPFIEASLKYKKAQAIVLRKAEAFVKSGDGATLSEAVLEMQKARAEFETQKANVESY